MIGVPSRRQALLEHVALVEHVALLGRGLQEHQAHQEHLAPACVGAPRPEFEVPHFLGYVGIGTKKPEGSFGFSNGVINSISYADHNYHPHVHNGLILLWDVGDENNYVYLDNQIGLGCKVEFALH